jgi:hypothetical protein
MKCCLRQEVCYGVRAHTFAGLMDLYELNYIRLRNLVAGLDDMPAAAVSQVPGALDLHLRFLERCRFTTTLVLTYCFRDEQGAFPAPDIKVRIYHDAQVAEVIACGRRRGLHHAEYNRLHHRYPLSEKWRMNRFLYKWLGYCLRQGHRFTLERESLLSNATSKSAGDVLLTAEP